MFDSLTTDEPRPLAFLKKAGLLLIALFLLVGVISAHRAYVQVHGLELRAARALGAGGAVHATVNSSGRTTVEVEIELVQGARAVTLGARSVPGNEYAFFDPRSRQETLTLALTPEALAPFEPGPARLRATAVGRPQWMRLPPPTVRELEVEIVRE